MRDKKDQLHAHLFMASRLIASVVKGEPDVLETPLRRSATGAMGGMALGIVALSGLMVWGFFSPGANTEWQVDGGQVIEEDTATRYLYLDGQLHPTLNVASAALATGSSEDPISVSSASLDDVPRGAPVGIVGAPDTLPDPDDLRNDAWAICATSTEDVESGSESDVLVAVSPIDADVADDGVQGADASSAILVNREGDTDRHLVVDGRRHRIADPVVLAALGYDRVAPVTVPAAWLNALEVGGDLGIPEVTGRGEPGPEIGGVVALVGQVFSVEGASSGSQQWYVLRTDGLQPVTELVAALVLGAPQATDSYPSGIVAALPATNSDIAASPVSASGAADDTWPSALPNPVDVSGDAVACVHVGGVTDPAAEVSVELRIHSAAPQAVPVPVGSGEPTGLAADLVYVEAGSGVLVGAQPNPGASTGTLFLVTEIGVKYPLASTEAQSSLGYGESQPVWLPAAVLDFLPTGPSLDVELARTALPIRPNTGG